jgi:hypothetical protein
MRRHEEGGGMSREGPGPNRLGLAEAIVVTVAWSARLGRKNRGDT